MLFKHIKPETRLGHFDQGWGRDYAEEYVLAHGAFPAGRHRVPRLAWGGIRPAVDDAAHWFEVDFDALAALAAPERARRATLKQIASLLMTADAWERWMAAIIVTGESAGAGAWP